VVDDNIFNLLKFNLNFKLIKEKSYFSNCTNTQRDQTNLVNEMLITRFPLDQASSMT
jgi:hypothetical protein